MDSGADWSVCSQVSSFPSSLQLLSVLQALLLLGPERADIWQALEALANRASLIAQSCESLSVSHTVRSD